MQVRKDIQIFVGNELSNVKKLPTTVISNNPCFKWILPDDIADKQTRFCLQIKCHTPHVLTSGKKDYAFYQSGDQESRQNFFEVNFGTTGLILQSWRGAIAVRLFISTKTKEEVENIQTPYEYVSDEMYMPGIDWKEDKFEIKEDDRYFVFDDKAETFYDSKEITGRWKNSFDLNNDNLKYFAEICKSPLFDESAKDILKFEVNDSKKTYTRLNAILENNNSYFFRIRAFDGLDYSEWSAVHGFRLTSNQKPVVEILSLDFIGGGDIKINFKVSDTQQKKITLKLLYSGGSVKNGIKAVPTTLETAHFFIITDENNGCGSFTWKSLINEQGDDDNFFLYLKGNDGFDDSDEFVYGVFSIHNKEIFKRKTSGGSYFLTFGTNGVISTTYDMDSYWDIFITASSNGTVIEHQYYGYNWNNEIFDNTTVYGMIFAENTNTFCVKTPQSFYSAIYHHGKYMLYDYMIPSKEDKKDGDKDDLGIGDIMNGGNKEEEEEKLEKDPYVVAPPYNPSLNTKEKGVNRSVVYSTSVKLPDGFVLPNGLWYNKVEQNKKTQMYEYLQIWGDELNGKYAFDNFVLEDNGQAPQYTFDINDLDETGYPKPISYSQFENVGENTPIYIKKYRIETGFSGEAKNFTVVKKNDKYERKYFSCRGTPPQIVYENGIPYFSYKGELINKYDPEDFSNEESGMSLPENAIYLPQSIWKNKLKFQNVAVPYYVPSTEAIYRPGDHRAGIVGKGEPIIASSMLKIVKKVTNTLIEKTPPVLGKLKIRDRENQLIGESQGNGQGVFVSSKKDVSIKTKDGNISFIKHDDTLESFLERNRDVVVKFYSELVVIYREANIEELKKSMVIIKDLNNVDYPYYACYDNEQEKVIHFLLQSGEIFDLDAFFEANAKKFMEIDLITKSYFFFDKDNSNARDFGLIFKGSLAKKQRYLPKVRKKGKDSEKFDFLDYILKGRFTQQSTMYYAGINGWSENEIVDDYNRAIKFICNIKLPDKLQELKIIYLQYYWDSYNMIHWTGNLGVETFVRIEYTKLEHGKELGWKDLIFDSSVYNEEIDAWLIKPQTYSSLIDNFNYKQFDDECQYRMRISGYDISKDVINSIGPVIATPDFLIDDDAINPFVIESMEYDPWTKRLEIKFRVDDLQGDLYDIISMKYTTDEKIWYDINLGDVFGETTKLQSNTQKNRETNNIIVHTIQWVVGGYINKSAEIRIQIQGTLSKYNVEFDYPAFSWVCWDNQKYKLATDEENSILGTWVRYQEAKDNEGKTYWKEIDVPYRQKNGELEKIIKEISSIETRYEKTDKTKTYDEWLQSTYEGGISLASRIQLLESEQISLNERLNNAKRLRFEAEIFTRKELIKQGFYCNGFENNDYKNPVFEWRVLNLPSKGRVSTIDWGSEGGESLDFNGDFFQLTDTIENYSDLINSGFKFDSPLLLPVGIKIDDESSPAFINILKDGKTNYLHIDNSNKVLSDIEDDNTTSSVIGANINVLSKKYYSATEAKINVSSTKKTVFYFELNTSYQTGKYEISYECYAGDKNIENKIQVVLTRIQKITNKNETVESILQETIISNIMVVETKPIKHQFFYDEKDKSFVQDTDVTKLIFKCTGDVYITNIKINVDELQEEEITTNHYNCSNIVVKGKIGNRQKLFGSNEVIAKGKIGKMLSDDVNLQDKYTVYYRVQLDFYEDFSSQRFGVPLRDIIFADLTSVGQLQDSAEGENGNNEKPKVLTRITGGSIQEGVFLVNKDVTNAQSPIEKSNIEQIIEDGKEMEGNQSETTVEETSSSYTEKRKRGGVTIPKIDLPGEWKNKELNSSFPDVFDESKFANGNFNGNYHWRLAPYNIVECDYEEISHSIIKSISTFTNSVFIDVYAISNENIESLNFNGNYWYKIENIIPHWEFDWLKESEKYYDIDEMEEKEFSDTTETPEVEIKSTSTESTRGTVTFPTDLPRNENGAIISGTESITHVPSSLDRSKPFVLKDIDEHNYYMFYSKPSVFNKNVIIQSMGKSWNKFGELSQIYPKYVLDNYSKEPEGFVSIFSPCAVFVSLNKKIELQEDLPKICSDIEATITVNVENQSELNSEVFVINKNTENSSELECYINVYAKETVQKKIYTWATAQQKDNSLTTVLFVSDIGKVDFEKPLICQGLEGVYHPYVTSVEDGFIMLACKNYLNKSCLFVFTSDNGLEWQEISKEPLFISENNISSPCINKEESLYRIYMTEWIGKTSQIISYETVDFISVSNKRLELTTQFFQEAYPENIVYNNPKNPCVIDDVYMGNKTKRLYFNVDMTCNGKQESIIKTMFWETGKWEKGDYMSSQELDCNIFGKSNVIEIKTEDTILHKEVRLEIELSNAYTSMPKECILQSDWINKDNYEEYGAVISPPRNFIYNTIIKEKKYLGE